MPWQEIALGCGLLGMIGLMRPALKADAFAKRESELAQTVLNTETDAFIKEMMQQRAGNSPPSWSRIDSLILRGGYLLLAVSYLIQLTT